MSIHRKIGTIAALGSGTAALAMLTGIAGARADDLQINQQLLNQRVDQLAAVGQNPGAGATSSRSTRTRRQAQRSPRAASRARS